MMNYSAGEVAKKLGISKDSLRYYEKEGLLPPIARDSSGHRVFAESDVDWVFLIRCLRETDMPISRIKKYVSLLMNHGVDSIHERRKILLEHKAFIKDKIATYKTLSRLIEKKLDFYDEALSSDHTDSVRCVDYASEWEHFRSILGGIKHD